MYKKSNKSLSYRRMTDDNVLPSGSHITISGYSSDDSQSRKLTVESIDNHIFFYADIDSDRCLALIQELHGLDAFLRSEHLSRSLPPEYMTPIWLHIQSNGGDVSAALALADQMARIKTPVYTVVEGICASAAVLLSLSGTKRYILPNSFMMIHELSAMFFGRHSEFEIEVALQQKTMDKLRVFIADRTTMTADDLKNIMVQDFWMDADEAISKGFVDEILR